MTDTIEALRAENDRLRKALNGERRQLIDAWEMLPGGRQQPVEAVERWLIKSMAPVVNEARDALAKEPQS